MKPRSSRLVLIMCASLKKLYRPCSLSGLTAGSCWTSSAAELLLEAQLLAVVDVVAGASAPNPESKLGFLAAALPLQLFIPRVEDDAEEVGIFPSLFAFLSLLYHLILGIGE